MAHPGEGVAKDTDRIWSGRNPNQRPNLTDNALMNQRRFIEKQNKLTATETDTEVDDVFVEETNNAVEETKVDKVEPSQNPSVIEDLAKEIRRAGAEWENTSMKETPST